MTTTLAGALLLLIASSYTVASILGKDDQKNRERSISADIYFAAFILLIGLYCAKPKDVKTQQVICDTVKIHDTIITHAPTAEDVIPAYNPRAFEVENLKNKK